MKRWLLRTFIAAISLCVPGLAVADKHCDSVLSVAPTVEEWRDDLSLRVALSDMLSKMSYQQAKDSMSWSGNLSMPIEGLPIDASGKFSEKNFDEWKSQYNRRRKVEYNVVRTTNYLMRKPDSRALEAWEKCLDVDKAVSCYFVPRPGGDATFVIRTNPGQGQVKVKSSALVPATGVTVSGPRPVGAGEILAKGLPLNSGPTFVTVQRQNKDVPVEVSVFNDRLNCNAFLPGIPKPPGEILTVTRGARATSSDRVQSKRLCLYSTTTKQIDLATLEALEEKWPSGGNGSKWEWDGKSAEEACVKIRAECVGSCRQNDNDQTNDRRVNIRVTLRAEGKPRSP